MNPRIRISAGLIALAVCILSSLTLAEDAYYSIPVQKLSIVEGSLPQTPERSWQKQRMVRPYAVLVGGGECWIDPAPRQQWDPVLPIRDANLAICAAKADEVSGTLFAPNADSSGMERIRFKVATAGFEVQRSDFLRAKLGHYRQLQDPGIPGAAWFRFQARTIAQEVGQAAEDPNRAAWRQQLTPADELSDTFSLFSGTRAVSENLQLDRTLPPATKPIEATVKIDTLPGITVQEMDWKELTQDLHPRLDPLAALIPADQHAIFFPTFQSAITLIDQAQRRGSILLVSAEPRSEDALTQQRYERQLCLPLSGLARAIGPSLVQSVAVTGSDPYLRMGSDVAILFQANNVQALQTLLEAQMAIAAKSETTAKPASGEVEGIAYTGLVSPDRRVCSYRAAVGDAVVVANSLAQLKRIVTTQKAQAPALASQQEYIFFRDRYKLGDEAETALIVLSDPTIRRWCGPKWRIADSRRTRAAAVLADLQAAHAYDLVSGKVAEQPLHPAWAVPEMGDLNLSPAGVRSSTYGSIAFMTPIAELDLDAVTKPEAEAYGRWRILYQQNWRNYFDPIAVRLGVEQNRIAADLTVMPLIAGTEYRQFLRVTEGAALKPTSGDPHDSIGHLALAINPDSDTIKGWGHLAQNLMANLRIEPLAWLGGSIALYADEDPFWAEMASAKEPQKFIEENFRRLPTGLYVESRDALRLAAFLTAFRGFAEQSAPGLTRWETLNYNDQPYAKVIANNGGGEHAEEIAIYYAAMPKALVVSLNEDVVKRAIDRLRPVPATRPAAQAAAASAPATRPAMPWLGDNVALQLRPQFVKALASLAWQDVTAQTQSRAWSNIPILNEWRRLFPDKDPVEVHQMLFGVRLVDPAGGGYTWNEAWQTMQSVKYGHPGEQKADASPLSLVESERANFGLSFEHKGVRARAELAEEPAK